MPNLLSELVRISIADLHPTQLAVGFREVAHKRARWCSRFYNALDKGAPKRAAPVVIGPMGKLYLIDRHHLTCAMRDAGVEGIDTHVIADFSALALPEFWLTLEAMGWCRPYDSQGRRRPFSEIPQTLDGLTDDPFRSLASALRRAGGFTKTSEPFSEFVWADFLRGRLSREAVVTDFDGSLQRARALAGTSSARLLPGWILYASSVRANKALCAYSHVSW